MNREVYRSVWFLDKARLNYKPPMNKTRIHSALAWALIIAQLLVVGLSQGQVVICHKANGSSHIELIGEYVSETIGGSVCDAPNANSPDAVLNNCSDVPCVDELLSAEYTIIRVRDIEHGHALGIVPTGPSIAILWMIPTTQAGLAVVPSNDLDALLLAEQLMRVRSTILNL